MDQPLKRPAPSLSPPRAFVEALLREGLRTRSAWLLDAVIDELERDPHLKHTLARVAARAGADELNRRIPRPR